MYHVYAFTAFVLYLQAHNCNIVITTYVTQAYVTYKRIFVSVFNNSINGTTHRIFKQNLICECKEYLDV